MQRLIDRDELLTVVEADMDVSVTGRDNMEAVGKMMKDILDDIAESPVVDAVPVIRCYECKHFREFEKGFSTDWDGSCKFWNTHSTVYSNFCGCAERKEE